jgi:four helix bundle protein
MYNKEKNKDIESRTYKFAVNIIKIVNEFPQKTAAFILGKQVIRSATSVNSNIVHARASLTKKEFTYYLNNAKKEVKETKNWLKMIIDSDLAKAEDMNKFLDENEEIIKILVTSVKTSQSNS